MSMDAITAVSQAEAEAKATVAAAEAKAKQMVAAAENAGKLAVDAAVVKADSEIQELRRQAEEQAKALAEE